MTNTISFNSKEELAKYLKSGGVLKRVGHSSTYTIWYDSNTDKYMYESPGCREEMKGVWNYYKSEHIILKHPMQEIIGGELE